MLIDPPQTEIICDVTKDEALLKDHFQEFFAAFSPEHDRGRFVSGIESPYTNARVGHSDSIEDDLRYFREEGVPFVWYVDEGADPGFETELEAKGFQDIGMFRGLISQIDLGLPKTELPSGASVELVQDRSAMEEFAAIVCLVFGMEEKIGEQYKEALWKEPRMIHWIFRINGKAVSGLTSYIVGDLVSVWNVATLPEYRRRGIAETLWKAALGHAVSKGCRHGLSYLTSEGMALGICKRLGHDCKWNFHAYLCP